MNPADQERCRQWLQVLLQFKMELNVFLQQAYHRPERPVWIRSGLMMEAYLGTILNFLQTMISKKESEYVTPTTITPDHPSGV